MKLRAVETIMAMMGLDDVLGGALVSPLLKRRHRRYQQEGIVECGFRDRTSSTPGLSRFWRHGIARIDPGVIVFQRFPFAVFRTHRLTKPVRLEVTAVSEDFRVPRGLETAFFEGLAFKITTSDGEIEWGLPPGPELDRAFELLATDEMDLSGLFQEFNN